MDKKDMFDFYQRHYYHEIDAREKFNGRMQIPIAIFATEFSIIAYFLKTSRIAIDDFFAACCFGLTLFFAVMTIFSLFMLIQQKSGKNISPIWLLQFIAYLALSVAFTHINKKVSNIYFHHLLGYIITSVIFLIPNMYYFLRASINYEYKFMPLCDAIENYRKELKEYYSEEEDCDKKVSEKMHDYIMDAYIECSSVNGTNNESRSFYFHRTYTLLIMSFIPIGLAVIPYYLGRVNVESDAVHKIEISKNAPERRATNVK